MICASKLRRRTTGIARLPSQSGYASGVLKRFILLGSRPHLYALLLFARLITHPSSAAADSLLQVRVSTNVGDFVVELMPDRAPLTVANFLRYVREGFYSQTLFHRVVPNFIIQGGGYSAMDSKLKPTHDSVTDEAGNGLQNKRGTVGVSRGDEPHSGNAQFYVNLADNPDLDPLATRWGYAVFGRVVQGMDVVDRIGAAPTGAVDPFKSESPLKPIVIEKVEVVSGPAVQSVGVPLHNSNR